MKRNGRQGVIRRIGPYTSRFIGQQRALLGKVIVLAGDCRQLHIVLPKASRAKIAVASFKNHI